MAEPQNFLSQAWVSETQVVVGTDQNTVMLFEGQELKAEFVVHGENKSDGTDFFLLSSNALHRSNGVARISDSPIAATSCITINPL